jgi:hypothetical protein
MEVRENEIIKALEYCLAQGITSECERCRDKIGCRDTLLRDALDLINRQKEEIERLRDLLHESTEDNNRWVCDCIQMQKDMQKLKSEARKEFAERFWVESAKILETNTLYWIKEIKNKLLAEMEERE